MKLLPNPARPGEDLWDAARIVPPGVSESFRLRHLEPGKKLTLILRNVPTAASEFDVLVGGKQAAHVRLKPSDAWIETRVPLPALSSSEITVELAPGKDERAQFQLWAVTSP
jgi:hypothetical protein